MNWSSDVNVSNAWDWNADGIVLFCMSMSTSPARGWRMIRMIRRGWLTLIG
jgi:hypothetical protein